MLKIRTAGITLVFKRSIEKGYNQVEMNDFEVIGRILRLQEHSIPSKLLN